MTDIRFLTLSKSRIARTLYSTDLPKDKMQIFFLCFFYINSHVLFSGTIFQLVFLQ